MDAFRAKIEKNCFFLPRFVFRCLGIIGSSNKSVKYQLYSCIIISLGYLYPWSNLHVILHNQDNFDVVANALFNFMGSLTACAEILVILCNRRRLQNIFDELGRIQEEYNTKKWSKRQISSINKKMIVGISFFYLAILCFYVITLTERILIDDGTKWRMPISDVSVLNITYSPNFEIAWAYQVIAVTLVSSAYCGTSLLIAALTVDLTVQFKIFRNDLKQKFDNIQKDLIKNNPENIDDRNLIDLNIYIKEIVVRHVSLLDLVGEVEKVSSHLVLLDVIGCLSMACFALYYASVLPPLDAKAIPSYCEVFVITISLFFICYCGTEITQASESVATACYEIDFVGTDIRFQKNLMMLITRSQKPVKLTVGGFADLSLTVFVWILRSTYTFFTVLRQSNDSNQG